MSIQTTRVRILTEAILKKNLQRGILPDSQEFIWQLEQALKDAGKNSAAFRFKPYRQTEVIQSSKYNTDNQIIRQDLLTLYQNLAELHGLLNKHYQYFDTEKQKLEKQIDVLENRLREHIHNANRAGVLPYAYDTFQDTSKVNLGACSDVFVDTQNNMVRLVEERTMTRRIIPQVVPAFSVYPEGLSKKERTITGNLSDIFSEKIDAVWQKEISLKEEQKLTGLLNVTFQKPEEINRVGLTFLTIKPFQLEASYSPDGAEWFALPNYIGAFEAQKQVSLDFPSIQMKQFKIEITKNEADAQKTDDTDYPHAYLFGLESLVFNQKQYAPTGIFESKPLDLFNEPDNYAVQTVSLEVDEWLPTGTQIDYEIALNEPNPDWQPIDPISRKHPEFPQLLSFLRMSKNGGEKMYFPTQFSAQQSEAEDLLTNGISLYRLSSLQNEKEQFTLPPRLMLEGSVRLYLGENAWEVTSFPSDDTTSIPELSEFNGLFDKTKIEYKVINESRNGDILSGQKDAQKRKYLCQLSLYLPEARMLTATPLASDPMSVYLNGERIFAARPGSERETYFVFRPGWNEIVVLINGDNATSVNGITASLGFQPKQIAETIYSKSTPLKEVSLFDLQYNTKRNDRSSFAKRQTDDGWEILTNFWSQGLSFTLHYDYKSEELPDHDLFLLRATFRRDENKYVPTPILRRYRIVCT